MVVSFGQFRLECAAFLMLFGRRLKFANEVCGLGEKQIRFSHEFMTGDESRSAAGSLS